MRPFILPLVLVTLLSGVTAASAAPTCQDKNGTTIRCGTADAMPVGWSLSPVEFNRRQEALQADNNPMALPNALCFIALLLILFALLPDFDGRTDADWGQQEGDDKTPR